MKMNFPNDTTHGRGQNATGHRASITNHADANPVFSEPKNTEFPLNFVFHLYGPDTVMEIRPASNKHWHPDLIQMLTPYPDGPTHLLAVRCGPDSNGLCVLVVDDQQAADQFFRENPELARTLVTTVGGSYCIWIRIPGPCPENVEAIGIQWFSSGSVLATDLPSTNPQSCVVTTPFEAVRWPAALEHKFFEVKTLKQYGPFYRVDESQKRVLNQEVFSRLIAHGMGFAFDTVGQTFVRQKPIKRSGEPIPETTVIEQVTMCLESVAFNDPTNFPEDELQLPRIKSLVEHLKLVVALPRP